MKNKIELEIIVPLKRQINLLYKQLKARKHNISHSKLPTLKEHEYFVKNNPYRLWFLVNLNGSYFGNIYVHQDNSIGLNNLEKLDINDLEIILDQIYNKVKPLSPIPSVRFGDFFFNIAINNAILIEKIQKIGYQRKQVTLVKNS